MRKASHLTVIAAATALCAGPALADEAAADLDVTMSVIADDGNASDVVDSVIELPEQAAAEAHENARAGLDQANEARQEGQEKGQSIAEESRDAVDRQLGRDISAEHRAEISAEAREQRTDARAGAELGAEVRTEVQNPLK